MSMEQVTAGKTISDSKWITDEEIPDPIPPNCPGWQIIVRPVNIMPKTKGGIILTPQALDDAKYLQTVGKVLAVGEMAYKDPEIFGANSKPWCKVGDYVAFRKLAGQKFWWERVQLIIMNDRDMIMGPFSKDQLGNLLQY